jgi:hypothetical protein
VTHGDRAACAVVDRGPDGVGKRTYAFRHIRAVSGFLHFVNLDEIAR